MNPGYYPHQTLSILANLYNDDLPVVNISDDDIKMEDDEYILTINDPKTGEEIGLAKSHQNPELHGQHLYYDPIKRQILISHQTEDKSEEARNSTEPDNVSRKRKAALPRESSFIIDKNLTGEQELEKVKKLIVRDITKYKTSAKRYKRLNLSVTLIVFILVGFIAMANYSGKINNIIIAAVALVVIVLQGVYFVFKLGKLGITYRNTAKTLKETLLEIAQAEQTFIDDEEKRKFALVVRKKLYKVSADSYAASYPTEIQTLESEKNDEHV